MNATHQATCVAIADRAILIEGPPGSGKSSLALALIDRGAVLIGDDGVLLEDGSGALMARPHPRTRGLLEVRNLGLLTFPTIPQAPIALVVALDGAAPRYRNDAEACVRSEVALPLVRIAPHDTILAVKVELALRHFGVEFTEKSTEPLSRTLPFTG